MAKAVESTVLSMVLEIVFGVGLALLLPLFFGPDSVLYSMPVSDILTAGIAAFLIAKTYRQLEKSENGSLTRRAPPECSGGARYFTFFPQSHPRRQTRNVRYASSRRCV